MSKPVSLNSALLRVGIRALFTAAAPALVFSCTSEPLTLRGQLCAVPGCAPGCEDLEVKACNINDVTCRELVFQSVRCVRGGRLMHSPETLVQPSFDVPPVTVPQVEPPAGEEIRLVAVDTALGLLKLKDLDVSHEAAVIEANMGVVARFDPENQQVTVLQDEHSVEWLSMLTLAHEYTHSLQDSEESLSAMLERYAHRAVERQGVRAFVEGEAELFGLLTYAFMKRADVQAWDVASYARFLLKNSLLGVARAQSPWYLAAATLHYSFGLDVLWKLWQDQGHVGVRRLGDDLDPDFGNWVNGELRGAANSRLGELKCAAPSLPSDFTWIAVDELGPSAVFAFAVSRLDVELGVPLMPGWALAKAVRRDELRLYAESDDAPTSEAAPFANLVADGNVVAEWAIDFDSEAHAADFARIAQAADTHVQRKASVVVLSVALRPDPLKRPVSSCSVE